MTSYTSRPVRSPLTTHRTRFSFSPLNKIHQASLQSLATLVCLLLMLTIDARAVTDDATLLEVGSSPVAVASKTVAPSELKIVSYNIRWRGGEDLQRIIELLRRDSSIGGAHIIGLQEVDRHTKRNGNVNTACVIAEALGMHYAWAAPPHPQGKEAKTGKEAKRTNQPVEDETGVAILSFFPMTNVERHVLPNPGPGKRRRAAIGATLIIGTHRVRVYSVHAETRISTKEKVAQFAHVLDALKQHTDATHAVVLGDFNTWRADDKRDTIKLFTDAKFSTPFKAGEETFRLRFVNWRLDWIWVRGFAPVSANGVAREIKISDHYPLWLRVNFNQPSPAQDAGRAGV
ncbi:MAG: endonuclease/exonuclease/phosphatase family protein [Pyrinomonadaceae bacterium MAG19_C2-C3]|nr:endonuclease/exonuclease/phosphatase family protein [Pyrinomonadaceae bacterium MAG19_C2-C3]